MKNQISNQKIKQVILILLILSLLVLVFYSLYNFIPALLGAIAMFVVFRKTHLFLVEKKKWKPWLSSIGIIVFSWLVVIVPLGFLLNSVLVKLSNSSEQVNLLVHYVQELLSFIKNRFGYDLVNEIDVKKIATYLTTYSASILNSMMQVVTTLFSMYFLFYFLLIYTREIEMMIDKYVPLKKDNIQKIEQRVSKMVIANVVGIPVIAIGQGFTLFIAYLIFGVQDSFLLFMLTVVASFIPIVGGALIYVPIVVMMMINGDIFGGVGILVFGVIASFEDNLFRFTFLKKLENIHPLNSVFGIILGMKLFGFIGIIFGPIIISLVLLLIEIYYNEFCKN